MVRALALLAVLTSVLQAGEWIKITSPNFELFTTAGERTGKAAIRHFEQVRAFFLEFLQIQSKSVNRIRLVGFSSEKEYQPYRPSAAAAAFYLPTSDRDYIVMERLDQSFYKVAVHEYVHLILKHADATPPPWLNEGMAEFYSTMTPVGNKVRIGLFDPGRQRTLIERKWLPLEQLLAVDRDSPEYNEKDRAGIFYAESWALVHMLYFDAQYMAERPRVFPPLLGGASAAEILPKAYGKPLSEIQKDLESYIRKDWQAVANVDSKLDAKVETPLIEKANPADAQLTLAHVINHGKKADQAREMLAKLAAEYPDNIEVLEALGYSYMRTGDDAGARTQFAAAAKLGSKNARMLRNYAYLLHGAGAKAEEVSALQQALAVEPDYFDARLQLAYALMSQRKFGEAYSLFAQVKSVKAEKAAAMFKAQAYCLIQLGSLDQAREKALQAKKYAKSPSDLSEIDRNLAYIDYRKAEANRPARVETKAALESAQQAPVAGEIADARTEIERQLSGEFVAPVRKYQDSFVTGTFVELECRPGGAIMHVSASGAKLGLVIEDPEKIRITGTGSDTVEMQCGKQPTQRTVKVGFGPPEKDQKADGIIGSIEFQ